MSTRAPKVGLQDASLLQGFEERLRRLQAGIDEELGKTGRSEGDGGKLSRFLAAGDSAISLLASVGRQIERGRQLLADRLTVVRADEFGFDPFFRDLSLATFRLLYHFWWRVELRGIENVPSCGPLVLVSNHSGALLPADAGMIIVALLDRHPARRRARALLSKSTPYAPGTRAIMERSGLFCSNLRAAGKLLAKGQSIVGFPEGGEAVGKYFKERHQLLPFSQKRIFSLAIHTGAPLVPVAVTGGEEAYPVMAKWKLGARGGLFPRVPVTPTFPWLGLLGLVPLPAKWIISFGKPVAVGPTDGDTAAVRAKTRQLSGQVRKMIQEMLRARDPDAVSPSAAAV